MSDETNRFSGRMRRYASVGTNVGGAAAKMAAGRLLGMNVDKAQNAQDLAQALGGLKGPLMKVAQLLSTIPEALPPEYAAELSQLQSDAPPMGRAFVRRRMAAELGVGWRSHFAEFDQDASASASLGQVHRATLHDGRKVACKLQYPDMESAVEADLNQLKILFGLHRQMGAVVDTSEIFKEIGARVREELDYTREASHMALYGRIFDGHPLIRVPEVVPEHSTGRLLTMTWQDGTKLLDDKGSSLEVRNRLTEALFKAWWYPFSNYGVIHGDPHLGNYTVFHEDGEPGGINLLDYGCIRIFPPGFIKGVIDLYHGLDRNDHDLMASAYERWGFKNLSRDLMEVLNTWAAFIYGPLLDNRVRTVADGISPGEYGRKQAFQVHQQLKEKGPVTIPREFVFMDRAAIGLGGVFLHMQAELNFYQLFNETIENFDETTIGTIQSEAFKAVGLTAPDMIAA